MGPRLPLSARNRKSKRGSRTIIWRRPQTAMMTFDNEATDGEANPHTASLSGVESFEEFGIILRVEAHPCILRDQSHMIPFVSLGSDQQLPRTIVDAAHSI
jgi:hypothetical protein